MNQEIIYLNSDMNIVMTFEKGNESRNEIFNEEMGIGLTFEKGYETKNEIQTKKWTLYWHLKKEMNLQMRYLNPDISLVMTIEKRNGI